MAKTRQLFLIQMHALIFTVQISYKWAELSREKNGMIKFKFNLIIKMLPPEKQLAI